MTPDRYPSIDLIETHEPSGVSSDRSRWKVFFFTLITCAAIGLSFVYLRPAIYQTSVSIVVAKAKDIDRVSDVADIENVEIQRRVLLGQAVLSQLSSRLEQTGIFVSPTNLLTQLEVSPEPGTNLIELSCTGEDAETIQEIANTWADIYDQFRRAQLAEVMQRTTQRITEEQTGLELEINQARQTLSEFRTKHNIVSKNREDNMTSSALRGLNRSLNSARESMLAAKSKVEAIERAIRRGEIIVPKEQRSSITQMQTEANSLRNQLEEARSNFTEKYIERDPFLSGIPAYLAELESTLESATALGQQAVREEAQRNLETEEQAYALLEQELSSRNRSIESFTENFKTFQALEEDLLRKQQLHADAEERLTQIRVSNTEKYPPIQIIERAVVPVTPISPNYQRDALIATLAALVIAVFVTWLLDYLGGSSVGHNDATRTLGIRVHNGGDSPKRSLLEKPPIEQLSDKSEETMLAVSQTVNGRSLPRELASVELQLLLEKLSSEDANALWLLLSGVAPHEYSLLLEQINPSVVDNAAKILHVPGTGQRSLQFTETGWQRITPFVNGVLTKQLEHFSTLPALDLAILTAARTSGIDDPVTVNTLTVWHSYVMYLVRQGANLATLEYRAGPIPVAIAANLGVNTEELELNISDFDYPLG